MSKIEVAAQEDFDFWEFVTCSRCLLPFNLDPSGAPSVPFWLTECGHVLCNNHIKPDRSCSKCGERDIQVTSLQSKMDQPMSTWFTAVPQSLYATAFAASFQYNQLATLVRHYKHKCGQQRMIIEKMKVDAQNYAELQNMVGELQEENQRLREYVQVPSDMPNIHGKRPMQDFRGAHVHSSPRSATPLGPNRLTLPPSHQQPNLSNGHSLSDDAAQTEVDKRSRAAGLLPSNERPGSRRFSEQYAYAPVRATEPQAIPSVSLAHSQYHPIRQAHGRRQHSREQQHISMSAPSAEPQYGGKFKPGAFRSSVPPGDIPVRNDVQPSAVSDMPPPSLPVSGTMAPPPVSHRSYGHSFVSARNKNATSLPSQTRAATPLQGSLPTQRFVPSTPSRHQQISAPVATPASRVPAFDSRALRAPSRLATGQRAPFVPHS